MSKNNDKVDIKFEEEDVDIPLPEEESVDVAGPFRTLQQMGLPSKYVEWLALNQKYILIGISIIVAIVIVAIIAVIAYYFLFLNSGGDAFHYEETTSTYSNRLGPIHIPAGTVWNDKFGPQDVQKPSGAISIYQIYFRIEDEQGELVAPEQVYTTRITLSNTDGNILTEVRHEGPDVTAVMLPDHASIMVEDTEEWEVSAKLINIWGLASMADVDVYINYTITYASYNSNNTAINALPVSTSNDWFQTITVGDGNGVTQITYDTTWDYTSGSIYAAVGFLSPGGLNISIYENTNGSSMFITSSIPTYNEVGYITSQEMTFPNYDLTQGASLRVIANYDSTNANSRALTYFLLYGDFNTAVPPPPPPPPPSASVTPSASPSSFDRGQLSVTTTSSFSASVSVTVSASVTPSSTYY